MHRTGTKLVYHMVRWVPVSDTDLQTRESARVERMDVTSSSVPSDDDKRGRMKPRKRRSSVVEAIGKLMRQPSLYRKSLRVSSSERVENDKSKRRQKRRSSVMIDAMNGVLSLATFGRKDAVDAKVLKTKDGGERLLKPGEKVVRMARSKHRNKLAEHNAKLQQQFDSVRPSRAATRDGRGGETGNDGDGDNVGDGGDGGSGDSGGGDCGNGTGYGSDGQEKSSSTVIDSSGEKSASQSLPPAQTLPSPFAQLFQYRQAHQ